MFERALRRRRAPRRSFGTLSVIPAAMLAIWCSVAPASAQEPVIPATTKVLTEASTMFLSMAPDGVVYTFSRQTSELEGLAPGDVIVSGISRAARYGFLRRVLAVSHVEEQVIVITGPATLKDAIREGRVHFSRTLTRDEVESATLAPGVTTAEPAARLHVDLREHRFDFTGAVLEDEDGDRSTTYDQVTATGHLVVQPSLDFDLDFGAETAELTLTVDKELDFRLDARVNYDLPRISFPIARQYFSPSMFWIGTVPIVIVPELSLQIGLQGELRAGVSASVRYDATSTAGVRYENGVVTTIGDASDDFAADLPTFGELASIKAFAGPRLSLNFFGVVWGLPVAGTIYGEVDVYLRVVLPSDGSPQWELYGGVEAVAGATLFGLVPVYSTVSPLIDEVFITDSGLADPLDGECAGPATFVLDPQRPELWGGIEKPGDNDWATVRPPSASRMLVALSLVGDAEEEKPNYDLALSGPCGTTLDTSSTTRPAGDGCDTDCQNGVGAWGDERILVDVTPDGAYRSHVYGHTNNDHVDSPGQASYHLAVAFGTANTAFKLLSKATKVDSDGLVNVTLEFQNVTTAQFRNITFRVRNLSGAHFLHSARVKTMTGREILLGVDDLSVRGIGAIVAVPNMAFCFTNTTSSMCTLQQEGHTIAGENLPDDRFKITFRIGATAKQPLTFAADIYATPTWNR